MDYEIVGISGKITVMHWHVGLSHSISVYNQSGNSVYFVVDSEKAVNKWIELFSFTQSGMSDKTKQGRAVIEVTRIGEEFHVEAYDIYSAGHRNKAVFNLQQASEIVSALRIKK